VGADAVARQWASHIATRAFPEPEWQGIFLKRFAVVEDEVFDFFCETALQVEARVRIDPNMKTVQHGALWYEESLPAESILSGLVWCGRVFGSAAPAPSQSDLVTEYCTADQVLQIGGKFSTGRGHVRLRFDATPGGVA
jgi:CRISPR-associated protein Cmr4